MSENKTYRALLAAQAQLGPTTMQILGGDYHEPVASINSSIEIMRALEGIPTEDSSGILQARRQLIKSGAQVIFNGRLVTLDRS